MMMMIMMMMMMMVMITNKKNSDNDDNNIIMDKIQSISIENWVQCAHGRDETLLVMWKLDK